MRFVRPSLAALSLTAALTVVAAPAAYSATSPSARAEVTVALSPAPGFPNETYQLSLNSSLNGKKATGGFSLLGSSGAFLGGRTRLYCPGAVTAIVNEVNPAKKISSPNPPRYLVIYLEDATNEVAFRSLQDLPGSCAAVPSVDPTTTANGDLQIT